MVALLLLLLQHLQQLRPLQNIEYNFIYNDEFTLYFSQSTVADSCYPCVLLPVIHCARLCGTLNDTSLLL